MSKRQTYGEKIATIPTETLSRMSTEEMKAELSKARYAVNRRLSAFSRRGIASSAAMAYLDTGGMRNVSTGESRATKAQKIRSTKIKDLSRNQALLELARIQAFFRAETSTVEGQERINLQQDKSIFGVDKRGRPNYRMSQDERTEFWAIFKEYYNQYPETYGKEHASEQIKTILGDIMVDPGFTREDFVKTMREIHERYLEEREIQEEKEREEFTPSVYTGHRQKHLSPAEKRASRRGRSRDVRTGRRGRRGK